MSKIFKRWGSIVLIALIMFVITPRAYARNENNYEGSHVYLLVNSGALELYNDSIETHIQGFARDLKKENSANRVSLVISNSYEDQRLVKEENVFDDVHVLSMNKEDEKPLDLTSNMNKVIELQKVDNPRLKEIVVFIDNDGGLSDVSFDSSSDQDFQKIANEHMLGIYSSAKELTSSFKPDTDIYVIRTRTPFYVLENGDEYDELFYLNQTRSMTEVLFNNLQNAGLYFVYFDPDEMKIVLDTIKEKIAISAKKPMPIPIVEEKRKEEPEIKSDMEISRIEHFNDVRETDWYYRAIQHVVQNSFMTGIGSRLFSPEESLSRAQLAQIIYNIDGDKSTGRESFFKDVQENQWYTEAVNWAYENGVVSGYGDGNFGPNDPVSREQAMTIMYRYIKKSTKVEVQGSPLDFFGDKDRISPYAIEAMTWASYEKVLNGNENKNLKPLDKIKRSEIAQILYKLDNKKFFVKNP